jgi:hypothetical protein
MRGLLGMIAMVSSIFMQNDTERWYQILASKFVTSTIQIDQKCIYWDIRYPTPSSVNATIYSHLHWGQGDLVITELDFSTNASLWSSSNPVYGDLRPREITSNYKMLMGVDNMTFFVLSRDPILFETMYKDDVIDLLHLWEYNVSYKIPEITYTAGECGV